MVAGLLICAAAGAAIGLAGCSRRGARAWIVHVTMAAAMLTMLVPAIDPFGSSGPLVWSLALGCLAVWTAAYSTAPSRTTQHASSAPAGASLVPAEATSAHPAARVRDLLDLWAMAFLLLLMPGLHGAAPAEAAADVSPPQHPAPLGAAHGDHTASATGALEVRGVVVALIVLWLATLLWLHLRERRAGLATAGSALGAAAMAGMALAL